MNVKLVTGALFLRECVFPALRPHSEDVLGPVAGAAQVVEHEEAAGSHGRRRPGVDALHTTQKSLNVVRRLRELIASSRNLGLALFCSPAHRP